MNPTLAAALSHARSGLRVIPVIYNTKRPAIKDWPTLATTDEATITKWFANGEFNIGIVAGPESDLFVFDLDRHRPNEDGVENFLGICNQIGSPPRGPIALTAGNGRHLLYQYPKTGIKIPKQLAPGIDLLGSGRFIVVAPSVVDGNSYGWKQNRSPGDVERADCTEWLEEAIALTPPASEPQVIALPVSKSPPDGTAAAGLLVDLKLAIPETPENVQRLCDALNTTPPCLPYDKWRNILFSIKAHGFSEGEVIARKWSASCVEKYDDAAFNKVWNSDKGRGVGAGTLYFIAKQYGWSGRPANEDLATEAAGDINNGRIFAQHFRGKLLFCHAAGKWLIWNGQRWMWCDSGQEMKCAKWVADRMLDDAVSAFRNAPNDGDTKELMRAAKALHSNEKRLQAMLNMAASEDGS